MITFPYIYNTNANKSSNRNENNIEKHCVVPISKSSQFKCVTEVLSFATSVSDK